MCGRFVRTSSPERLQTVFEIQKIAADLQPSFNVAPTQKILSVVQEEDRTLTALRWGLIPSWADDPAIGNRMINARSEGVMEKPSFRSAFRRRRCLIPADGFYEWLKQGGEKIPFYFHLKENKPLAFAGLWETNDKSGETLTTCTILTTEANEVMAPIHDRMPVILPAEEYDHWLDPEAEPEELMTLLRPYEDDDLTAYPVSKKVNSPRNDGPELLVPDETVNTPSLLDAVPDERTPNSK
jgi:putative SOS response-associated peptidase YedK